MSKKRMLSGKRILAGILTAVMVFSSAQLPMSAVYAEEITVSVQEDENGNLKQEAGEDLSSADNTGTENLGENEGTDVEDPSQSDDTANGENPVDGEDGVEESDTEELYVTGISANDLVEPELQETMTEDELEGVYQFGGAPSKRGNLSLFSESVYSVESSEIEKHLYGQMLERNTTIDISAYNIPYDSSGVEILGSLVSSVLNEHPDLYFVERRYGYRGNGTIITAITFTYNNTYDDAAFKQSVTTALSRVNDQMSDLEKAVVLHDYLTVNCEYDYQNYLNGTIPSESYNAYGTLVNCTAVCQGYALTYKYLLSQVGIDCYMVTSSSMNHAWNMIVLDGKNYQVDVTWDDPVWDKIGRSMHNYMFCSDAVFQDANHNHHDWSVTSGSEVVDYQATDTRYDNAFWTECKSPLVLAGDDCYYVSSERSVNKTNLSEITNKGTTVVSIGTWPVWGGGGTWSGSYSGLFQISDRLYYNDNSSIYSIAMDGTSKRKEFTADTTTGYIYGSAYCQGKVLYALHKDPNETGKEEVLVADITVEGSDPVDVPVQRVELSAYTLELAEGEETELSATVYPTYATDSAVTWTSDDETVAAVDNGRVRAVSVGSCTVTATAGGKKADCTVQVTAKGDNGGLGLDNLSYEYTTVDDAKISSAANGRPKLLIFYSNGCGNCRNTIRGISSKIDQFAGIDVYALETNQGTKEEVIAFQQQYGCKEITFSYDKDRTNSNSMWAYARAGGISAGGTISWPVICYIDANNRLQYMTMSFIVADEVLSNLKKYCNAAEETPIQLGDDTDVIFKTNRFTYNGTEQDPKVVVRALDTVLTEEQDYTLSYSNNKNAGIATVTIDGKGRYLGSISRTFEIEPAQIVITAQDKAILIGEPVPAANEYKYKVSGLMADDALITEPVVSCEIVNSTVAGQYDIVLSGADAGNNYIISYVNGRLTVASEYVSCTVRFDVQGHGTAPKDYFGIRVGETIDRPDDPSETGYRFDGWYRDAACTKAWNFESDIVQSDMTLYAKWLGGSVGGEFTFQEIADVYYTGKVCKPAVSVYDGDTLLKLGRDYQIKYYNNTNANKDGMRKKGNGEGIYFNKDLPYVEIIGKGNYTDRIKGGNKDTVKVNFNILRVSIGDGSSQAADGIVLKVTDQLVTAKKAQKPFTSIKYVKGMKKDTDYSVSLTVVNARDQSGRSLQKGLELEGAAVPADYSGKFLLTVAGAGNYEGSICREIHVADKAHLIKNTKITLGKNLKNITFTGKPVQLKSAETDSADTFSVKCGNTFLKPGRDYTVNYRNHDRVGKAELIITGMGEYAGSKTATFNINGRSFTAKTVLVEDIEDKVYTGRAITQNGVKLKYGTGDGKPQLLRYGTDYTISYSKNINKGTATMTFRGVANAGYSGSFKKTFKIAAADITQVKHSETMQNMVFNYCKAGVKPVSEIMLTNQEGFILRNGKDYTLGYANNKAVAKASGGNPPTVTVKGKGNYAGEFSLNFEIIRTDLRADSIQIKTTPVAYNVNKAEDYAYKPVVKLTDGKAALRAGTDYEIEYWNNTQADYKSYIQKLQSQTAAGADMLQDDELTVEDGVPMAVITEVEGSSYRLEDSKKPIIVPLPIYEVTLTKANLSVEIGEAVYTGNQIKPEMTVLYDGKPLKEGEDYSLSYGANTASGKNKGSVVINGIAPNYGGSVIVKFDITKKPISY